MEMNPLDSMAFFSKFDTFIGFPPGPLSTPGAQFSAGSSAQAGQVDGADEARRGMMWYIDPTRVKEEVMAMEVERRRIEKDVRNEYEIGKKLTERRLLGLGSLQSATANSPLIQTLLSPSAVRSDGDQPSAVRSDRDQSLLSPSALRSDRDQSLLSLSALRSDRNQSLLLPSSVRSDKEVEVGEKLPRPEVAETASEPLSELKRTAPAAPSGDNPESHSTDMEQKPEPVSELKRKAPEPSDMEQNPIKTSIDRRILEKNDLSQPKTTAPYKSTKSPVKKPGSTTSKSTQNPVGVSQATASKSTQNPVGVSKATAYKSTQNSVGVSKATASAATPSKSTQNPVRDSAATPSKSTQNSVRDSAATPPKSTQNPVRDSAATAPKSTQNPVRGSDMSRSKPATGVFKIGKVPLFKAKNSAGEERKALPPSVETACEKKLESATNSGNCKLAKKIETEKREGEPESKRLRTE